MVTSADRSRVLTTLPTEVGTVVGRSYEAFGAVLYSAIVRLPDVAGQLDEDGELGVWSHTGRGTPSSHIEQEESLSFDDYLLIGHVPLDLGSGEPLRELPTEPGSVIARVHRTQGLRIAVLNADPDPETDESDVHYWARSGLDAWPTLKQSAKWLKKHHWVLVGVIPPGDARKTAEQKRAANEFHASFSN